MEKKFVPITKPVGTYLPARLVKAKDRWYISYYATDPSNSQYTKHRFTGDLNRIKDLKLRARRAKELIEMVNTLLPSGYPYVMPDNKTQKQSTPLIDAINIAIDIKTNGARLRTRQTYHTFQKKITTWAANYTITISDFNQEHATDFMDTLTTKKISATTYNNHLILAKALFAALVHRKYLPDNPFTNLQKKKNSQKTRRAFTPEERHTVATYIRQHHTYLYLGLILEYYGHIRPAEMRRLTIADINTTTEQIFLSADKTKNGKERHVTMPAGTILPYQTLLSKYPAYYLIFASGFTPGTKRMGHNAMNRAHTTILTNLKKQGKLTDTTGLTWYSWKDTGITDLAAILPLPEVQAQAGHADPATTLIYYRRRSVRAGYKNLIPDL